MEHCSGIGKGLLQSKTSHVRQMVIIYPVLRSCLGDWEAYSLSFRVHYDWTGGSCIQKKKLFIVEGYGRVLISNVEWVDLRVANYQWTSPLVLIVEGRMRCYSDINLMIHEKFFEFILG